MLNVTGRDLYQALVRLQEEAPVLSHANGGPSERDITATATGKAHDYLLAESGQPLPV